MAFRPLYWAPYRGDGMGVWAGIAGLLTAILAAAVLWAGGLRFAPPPRWSEPRVRFLGPNRGSQTKGDFGELLTGAILTQTGWRQLPSKLDAAGHGIDGVFVRRGWLGLRVLITETKVNASPFKLHQLSNTKLIRALGDLYVMGVLEEATAAAIVRGLEWRSPAVRKEHWHHSLHKGLTTVRHANRHGQLVGRARVRDTAALMESLAMGLSGMDREGMYVDV